jgi:hypothetical protein
LIFVAQVSILLLMIARIAPFIVWVSLAGCLCPGSRPDASSPAPAAPAAIQRTFSYIDGVVDSVLAGPADQVRLAVTVTSVRAGSSGASMAEPGMQIVVAPEGRALTYGHAAKRGQTFTGSLAKAADGGWILLDAEAR